MENRMWFSLLTLLTLPSLLLSNYLCLSSVPFCQKWHGKQSFLFSNRRGTCNIYTYSEESGAKYIIMQPGHRFSLFAPYPSGEVTCNFQTNIPRRNKPCPSKDVGKPCIITTPAPQTTRVVETTKPKMTTLKSIFLSSQSRLQSSTSNKITPITKAETMTTMTSTMLILSLMTMVAMTVNTESCWVKTHDDNITFFVPPLNVTHHYIFHYWDCCEHGKVKASENDPHCLEFGIKRNQTAASVNVTRACYQDHVTTNCHFESKIQFTIDTMPRTKCVCYRGTIWCDGFAEGSWGRHERGCIRTRDSCVGDDTVPCTLDLKGLKLLKYLPTAPTFPLWLFAVTCFLNGVVLLYFWKRIVKPWWFKFFIMAFLFTHVRGEVWCPGTTSKEHTLIGCDTTCHGTKTGYSLDPNSKVDAHVLAKCIGSCSDIGVKPGGIYQNNFGGWFTGCGLIHRGCYGCWLDIDMYHPVYTCLQEETVCTWETTKGTYVKHHPQKPSGKSIIPDLSCVGKPQFDLNHQALIPTGLTCSWTAYNPDVQYKGQLRSECVEPLPDVKIVQGTIKWTTTECMELDPKMPNCANNIKYPCIKDGKECWNKNCTITGFMPHQSPSGIMKKFSNDVMEKGFSIEIIIISMLVGLVVILLTLIALKK